MFPDGRGEIEDELRRYKMLGDVTTWEELDKAQSIIVGSPETVRRKIAELIEKSQVGNLLIQFHLGNMPADLVLKSERLFATQVAPALREESTSVFQKAYPAMEDQLAHGAVA